MSWFNRLRFWASRSGYAQLEAGPAVPLDVRIGLVETELREIERDVYAVLRDSRSRLQVDH